MINTSKNAKHKNFRNTDGFGNQIPKPGKWKMTTFPVFVTTTLYMYP